MKRYMNRRTMSLVAVLLASQMLSACIIIPRPFLPHRVIVGVASPGYNGPPPGEYRGHRGWERH